MKCPSYSVNKKAFSPKSLFVGFIFLFFNSTFLIAPGCSPTEPIFKDNKITLKIDAEVTETWITLYSEPVEKNATYFVKRDNQLIFEGKLTTNDTLIHDDNLEITTTYNYSVYAKKNGEKSKTITSIATTMDTTSNDFTWETYTVSERLDVNLHDVSIVDENNIWVVGYIPNPDSANYNAINWDGEKWNLERIMIKGNIAPEGPHEINSIFTISTDNIWVSHGSYGHWDGGKWESEYKALPWRKIWGDKNNTVWFVGSNGKISSYNGVSWQTGNSKTTINLRDIYGYYDPESLKKVIYTCGFNLGYLEGVILRKENDSDWKIFDSGENGLISSLGSGNNFASIWMANINTLFVTVFNDVFKIKQLGENLYYQEQVLDATKGIYRIRGNGVNDLFVAGDGIQLRHYNGVRWHHYEDVGTYTRIKSLDFKDDIIVAVSSGAIFVGRRN